MEKCNNCSQLIKPKLRYEKIPGTIGYDTQEYTLEYCDNCYVEIFSIQRHQQLTSGKLLVKNIAITSLKSLISALLITGSIFIFVVFMNGMRPSILIYSAFLSLLFGLFLLFFKNYYHHHTRYKAISEVSKHLQEINDRNNDIVNEVIKRKEEVLRQRKQQQYEEELRRRQNEHRFKEEELRKEKERKESERKAREWNRKVQERLCGIEEIDKMDGFQFEQRLKYLFQDSGYQVDITPKSGDQGVDLVLIKDNVKIAVQAKRYGKKNKVGNAAIQEVHTGKTFYDCYEAWVITTSYYTESAIALGKKVGVRLINRNELIHFIMLQQELYKEIIVCPNCGVKNNVDLTLRHRAICGNCKHPLKSSM